MLEGSQAAARSAPRTCPLCREDLGDPEAPRWACEVCRTDYHLACAEELGGCSTLGCAGRAVAARRARTPAPGGPPPAEPAPALRERVRAARVAHGRTKVGAALGLVLLVTALGLSGALSLATSAAAGLAIGLLVAAVAGSALLLWSGAHDLARTSGLTGLLGRAILVAFVSPVWLGATAVFVGFPLAALLGEADAPEIASLGVLAAGLALSALSFVAVWDAWRTGRD